MKRHLEGGNTASKVIGTLEEGYRDDIGVGSVIQLGITFFCG